MCLHGLVHRVRYRDFHCKEKVKVSSQRKSYILTVDVNENESAKNYPSGVTLTVMLGAYETYTKTDIF